MPFNSENKHVVSESLLSGVLERTFSLDEITGVIWMPASGTSGPLLLAGHAGGMHKKAPGLVAGALRSVTTHGFTVVAIDAPGHGDRPRSSRDEQWAEKIHQARAAGESIASIVVDFNAVLAERALPEWQATLDALQELPDVDAGMVGYGGVSLGVVTGLALAAVDSRIAALSIGAVFVDDALIEVAGRVNVPIEYRIPLHGRDFDRASGLALFDAFGSEEKALHVHPGAYNQVPEYERESSDQFFHRHLGGASEVVPQ